MSKPKLVVLGGMTKMPVAGIVFITMQYVVGLRRLGFDVYYAEAETKWPVTFMRKPGDDAWGLAAEFVAGLMRRFDVADDHWSVLGAHDDGRERYFGLSKEALGQVLHDADFIFNLHGGTLPRPEHYATNRLVWVGTDPVEREVDVYNKEEWVIGQLGLHCAYFTWGENHGAPDCKVPVDDRFHFIPTRQPMLLDLWEPFHRPPAEVFTTIGNWRQMSRPIVLDGERYEWSKHFEFLKFLDLPLRCKQPIELALSSLPPKDQRLLETYGWRVRTSMEFTFDLDTYREYIGSSRGEYTVAKDQNVRLRSGWFSDRSASYLACGRPVITQETGFSNVLPTGEGLFGFSTFDEIEEAIARINADYERHSRAAQRIAREHFDYRVVLGKMVEALGLKPNPQT